MLRLNSTSTARLEELLQTFVFERFDHSESVARCATRSSRIAPAAAAAKPRSGIGVRPRGGELPVQCYSICLNHYDRTLSTLLASVPQKRQKSYVVE